MQHMCGNIPYTFDDWADTVVRIPSTKELHGSTIQIPQINSLFKQINQNFKDIHLYSDP